MSYLFGGTPFNGYERDGRRSLRMGGNDSGPTSTTTNTSNIPDWMRPQVETALGTATQQIFNVDESGNITGFRPYVPYSTKPQDYVAGFSPMQQQAFKSAANLQTPSQFGVGSNLAAAAGQGALGSTNAAMNYGGLGAGYGAQGAATGQQALGYGAMGTGYGAQAAGAGQQYAQQATSPSAVQAYMSPYQQLAVDAQKREAQRAFDIQTLQRNTAAAKSGAFGGSRQGIEQAEAQRNLNTQLQNIQASGDQAAYDRAMQSMQYGSGLGLQGLQAGMQGAQVGLQGVQGALAGTAQGMQGAQAGLQGVQAAQSGYGLANQAAGQLGQLGSAQLGAQQNIIGLQSQLGSQQQQLEQSKINQAINNYAMAQQYPQQQLAFYNSLLRGYATPTVTTSQYQASPNPVSQLAGLGLTGAAAYGMMNKKKGGVIKAGDGLEELGMYRAMKGKK